MRWNFRSFLVNNEVEMMSYARNFRVLSLCLGSALLWVSGSVSAVTVYGAVSTTNAMEELVALYKEKGLGTVTLSLGATSTQARQVERGAPADLFISADNVWMDYLDEKGKIIPETRMSVVRNTLAIITQKDRELEISIEPGFDLSEALGNGRLAVGDPDHTSVGIYFKEAMESLGAWESIENRLARAQSVRAGTALVERGEVPIGVSFGTEVAISDRVRHVATFPQDSHSPIAYPIAVVSTGDRAAAEQFISFLTSDEARTIWERWMFVPDF